MTAGYRSRVTGGAGGVCLRAAGEQHTHVVKDKTRIIVPSKQFFSMFKMVHILFIPLRLPSVKVAHLIVIT